MKKRKVFIWALIVLIVLVVVACVVIFVTCDHDTSSQDDDPSTTTPDDDGNDSHDHVYGEWVIEREATCTDEGMRVRICEVCEDEQTEIILALGHDIIEHAGQAATCTQEGWEAYETCSRCDYTTYVTIPELGHDIVYHAGQTATCMQAGWEAYETCSRCDYTTYMAIPAAGHRLVPHAGQAATCTQSGWVTYETCENCDYTTYAAISELGHLYVNGVCDRCGVAEQVESITLDQDEIVLGIGGSTSIRATTDPATASVVWESSDDSVVTVTAFGKSVTVQAIGAGIATVTAKAGTQEATCTVLVQPTESALCPDFTVQVYDNVTGELTEQTYSPETSRGKVTVINFWGTWCDPCKAELPYFDQIASEDEDVVIVTVHSILTMNEAPAYIAENYPNSRMIFTQDSAQTFNDTEFADVYALLGGRGSYPRTLILDSEGVITYTFTGSLHYEDLVAEIEKAKDA